MTLRTFIKSLVIAMAMSVSLNALAQPTSAPASQPGRRGFGARGPAQPPPPKSMIPRDDEPFTPDNFNALKPNLPTLIIAGDSTADKGPDAYHRGWAAVLIDYFDTNKINVVNRARGGRSYRSYVYEGIWDQIVAATKPGDFVMIQFGHNDGGTPADNDIGRADVQGMGDETVTVTRRDGKQEIVHSTGWYTRKFIKDVRDKGATPIVMAATPYNRWTAEGKFQHTPGDLSKFIKPIAEEEKVLFMDHTEIIDQHYDQLDRPAVEALFGDRILHTNTPGAIVNAECFIAGLKQLDVKPLLDTLNDKGKAIPAYKPAATP